MNHKLESRLTGETPKKLSDMYVDDTILMAESKRPGTVESRKGAAARPCPRSPSPLAAPSSNTAALPLPALALNSFPEKYFHQNNNGTADWLLP